MQFYVQESGDSYRGDKICLSKSTSFCMPLLKQQIEIVKPEVVVTLGYYPLWALAKIYYFSIRETLQKTIQELPEIQLKDFRVVPLYHPVAQIRKEEQLKQYRRIWKKGE